MIARDRLLASYRIPVIWGGVIAIAVGGLLAGLLVWALRPTGDLTADAVLTGLLTGELGDEAVVAFVDEHADDPDAVVDLLAGLWIHGHETAIETVVATLQAEGREDLATAARALSPGAVGDHGTPAEQIDGSPAFPDWFVPVAGETAPLGHPRSAPLTLRLLADQEPPPRWPNRLLGAIASAYDHHREAATAFGRAGRHPEAATARQLHIRALAAIGDHAAIAALLEQPAYREACPSTIRIQVAVTGHDWLEMLRHLPFAMYEYTNPLSIVIGLVGGAAWFAILWHCLHRLERRRELALLAVTAVALGVLSTWLTIAALYITEDGFGFTKGESAFSMALYAVAGIGLREETCKLLCFLPLAWIAVRRHPPLAWFMLASLVGLGFAIEENITNYPRALSARFLTANFFHIALTGLIGLSCCEALQDRRLWGQAGSVFLLGVSFHGLYDAFLIVPLLAEDWAWVYMLFLLAVAVHYFRVLRHLRPAGRPSLSLTATFAWGLSATIATTWAVYAAVEGPSSAAQTVFPGLLATVLISIAFVRGIADPLSP